MAMAFWHSPLRKLLDEDQEARVLAAIRAAELRTSGEIRVHVERRCEVDAMEAARRWFARLGMDATAERNGILFYVAVSDRKFAVVGDSGIHAKVGEGFWTALRDAMAGEFAKGRHVEGLIRGIAEAGERLAEHFPRGESDRNELPDGISG